MSSAQNKIPVPRVPCKSAIGCGLAPRTPAATPAPCECAPVGKAATRRKAA